jgi:hypothetical protein
MPVVNLEDLVRLQQKPSDIRNVSPAIIPPDIVRATSSSHR